MPSTGIGRPDKRQDSLGKELTRPLCRPGDFSVTRCPGIPSYPQFTKVRSDLDAVFFQIVATCEARGSCDTRFFEHTLRRKVFSEGGE
jgi:hypothetical protein